MKDEIFHLISRGVEKRIIFLTEDNYLRFAHNLIDFNTKQSVDWSYHARRKVNSEVRLPKVKDMLVDCLCWALMPNHPHILVVEKVDGGSGKFSRKLMGGYTRHFNLINNRSGVLFQGKTKIIPVVRNEHFLFLPFYILSNPIKLIEPKWKENGIQDHKKVIKFLENYRWSSYLDIIGKDNFPFAINKKLFFEIYDTNEKKFKKEFINWLLEQ